MKAHSKKDGGEQGWADQYLNDCNNNTQLLPIDWNVIQYESDEIIAGWQLDKNEGITLGQSEFNSKNK